MFSTDPARAPHSPARERKLLGYRQSPQAVRTQQASDYASVFPLKAPRRQDAWTLAFHEGIGGGTQQLPGKERLAPRTILSTRCCFARALPGFSPLASILGSFTAGFSPAFFVSVECAASGGDSAFLRGMTLLLVHEGGPQPLKCKPRATQTLEAVGRGDRMAS